MPSEYDGWKVQCDATGCRQVIRRDTQTAAEWDAQLADWGLHAGRWLCPEHRREALVTRGVATTMTPWLDGPEQGASEHPGRVVSEDDGHG